MIRNPMIRDHIPKIAFTIVVLSIVAAIFALGARLGGGWSALVALALAILLAVGMAFAVNQRVPHNPPRAQQH